MSREIKFRAWNKDSKEWVDDISQQVLQIYLGMDGEIIATDGDNIWNNIENLELNQYTGMKDKDGKEIYEGDLLEHDDFDGIAWATYEPNEVVYDDEEGIVCFKNDSPNLLSYYRNLKVVGNIYENPELLKGEPNADKQKL